MTEQVFLFKKKFRICISVLLLGQHAECIIIQAIIDTNTKAYCVNGFMVHIWDRAPILLHENIYKIIQSSLYFTLHFL